MCNSMSFFFFFSPKKLFPVSFRLWALRYRCVKLRARHKLWVSRQRGRGWNTCIGVKASVTLQRRGNFCTQLSVTSSVTADISKREGITGRPEKAEPDIRGGRTRAASPRQAGAAIPSAASPVPTATAAAAGRTEPFWGGPCRRAPSPCHRPASGGLGVGGLPSAKMVHHSGSIQSFRHQKGRWQPSGSGAARGALRSGGVRCPHAAAALRSGAVLAARSVRGGCRRGCGTAGWCLLPARRLCFPTRTKVRLWWEVVQRCCRAVAVCRRGEKKIFSSTNSHFLNIIFELKFVFLWCFIPTSMQSNEVKWRFHLPPAHFSCYPVLFPLISQSAITCSYMS